MQTALARLSAGPAAPSGQVALDARRAAFSGSRVAAVALPCGRASRLTVSTTASYEPSRSDNDFGARDATAGEIESNFTAKVLGNFDTAHLIKPPEGFKALVGLSAKTCGPQSAVLLSADEAELGRKKVPGWRMQPGATRVAQEWRAKGPAEAAELISRVTALATAAGHPLASARAADASTVAAVGACVVTLELGGSPASSGGLTENDFILASKINDMEFGDLLVKRARRVGF